MKRKKQKDNHIPSAKLALSTIKDKLEVGHPYKYRELCELLGQTVYRGTNQKKSQLKEFQRYFAYDYIDQQYTITDIYDEVMPPLPNKTRSNNKYLDYIEYLLLLLLYKTDGYELICTRKQLWEKLSMINSNYITYGYNNNTKAALLDEMLDYDDKIKIRHIYNFYNYTHERFYDILRNALKSLEHRAFIVCTPILLIGENYNNMHEATTEELSLWAEGKREIMEQYGLEYDWQVRLLKDDLKEKYFDDLNKRTKDLTNSTVLYQGLKIAFHHYGMERALEKDADKIYDIRRTFNNLIQETVMHGMDDTIKNQEMIEMFGDEQDLIDSQDQVDELRIWLLLCDYLIKI